MTDPADPIDLTDALRARVDRLSGGFGRVMRAWEATTGRYIARHCIPTSLREGVLRVRCSNAAWTSELLHMAPELLPRLEQRMGDRAPTEIKPYTGRVPQVETGPAPPPQPTRLPPLPRADMEHVQRATASIADPDLRARVVRAMTASMAAHRARGTQGH